MWSRYTLQYFQTELKKCLKNFVWIQIVLHRVCKIEYFNRIPEIEICIKSWLSFHDIQSSNKNKLRVFVLKYFSSFLCVSI